MVFMIAICSSESRWYIQWKFWYIFNVSRRPRIIVEKTIKSKSMYFGIYKR